MLVPVAHSESQGINSEAQELERSLVLEIREASILLFTSLNFDAGNTGEKKRERVREKVMFGFRDVCRSVIGSLI